MSGCHSRQWEDKTSGKEEKSYIRHNADGRDSPQLTACSVEMLSFLNEWLRVDVGGRRALVCWRLLQLTIPPPPLGGKPKSVQLEPTSLLSLTPML